MRVRVEALLDPDVKVIRAYCVDRNISGHKMKEAPTQKKMPLASGLPIPQFLVIACMIFDR